MESLQIHCPQLALRSLAAQISEPTRVEHRGAELRRQLRTRAEHITRQIDAALRPRQLCLGCLDRPEPTPGTLCARCAGRTTERDDSDVWFRAQSTDYHGFMEIDGTSCGIEYRCHPGARILGIR